MRTHAREVVKSMRARLGGVLLALTAFGAWAAASSAHADAPTIRLRSPSPSEPAERPEIDDEGSRLGANERRGFDYGAFDARLEALWFQRKAMLSRGREADAAAQADLIRAFCVEEGVRRLETLSAALLMEAGRDLEEGHYAGAEAALDLADFFDPGRSQVHLARAEVLWRSGQGPVATGAELLVAGKASVVEAWRDLTLLNHVLLIFLLALMGCVMVFSLLMLLRYQVPLRHEVEERLGGTSRAHWGQAAGWATVLLPLVVWPGAGWAGLYWIAVTFRFMRRAERLAAVVLLCATAAAVPAFRVTVALYGMTEDPMVRSTLDAARGTYDPDRIVRLRKLVEAHPEDPVYRFLLAGLYKNGRYFEEAYAQYKAVLEIDPSAYQAHINAGNIFYLMGQYAQAVVQYRKALETRPDSVLAQYNTYLAQSESFQFKAAEEALERGNATDRKRMANLLYDQGRDRGRPIVVDASLDLGSLWGAALAGRSLRDPLESGFSPWKTQVRALLNPVSLMALASLLACFLLPWVLRAGAAARRCIRCGKPFCMLCKSGRDEGKEYCTQCLHLFVLGDGLAPGTKNRKLYEVERHARRSRAARRLGSLFLPGTAQILQGRTGRGCLLLLAWIGALLAWQPEVLVPIGGALGADLRLELLLPASLPARFAMNAHGALGLLLAIAVWLVANARRLQPREA